MCGIIGITVKKTDYKIKSLIEDGVKNMRHRGPDSEGIWVSEDYRVAIGHTRLAIQDLSTAGHQPMLDEDANIVITFNGEIYNVNGLRQQLIAQGLNFKSRSDTEVILAAYKVWGERFPEKLDGMYSIGIFDSSKNLIYLVRDRAGEKPLYYYHDKNALIFSSDQKSIFGAVSKNFKVRREQIETFLYFGFIPENRSLVTDIKKVPPGTIIKFNLNTFESANLKYWEGDYKFKKNNENLEYSVKKLDSLLDESVKKQLISDVGVGVLLSGGLDSSLITAYASSHLNNLRTYSVTFPDDESSDESAYAKIVSNHFGTNHMEIEITDPPINIMDDLVRHFDDPIIDSSMIPTFLLCRNVKKYSTVVLGGDGADELFGGYDHYRRLLFAASVAKMIPPFLLKRAVVMFSKKNNDQRLQKWIDVLALDFEREVPQIAQYFMASERSRLLGEVEISYHPENIVKAQKYKTHDLLSNTLNKDFIHYLREDILVKVDRASMAHALEIRSPFLSKEVIEFAQTYLPSSMKASSRKSKIILKKLAAKKLPQNLNINRKKGFSVPISSWMKAGEFRDLAEQTLLSKDCIFRFDEIKKIFNRLDEGENQGERLFGLMFFELWRQKYGIEYYRGV